jgi:hypothetical protein
MKKMFALLFCLLFLTFGTLFISCDSNDNKKDDDPPDTTQVPDTTRPDSTGAGVISLLGSFNGMSSVVEKGLVLVGNYMYVCNVRNISIVDVSNPSNPFEAARFPSTGEFRGYPTGLAVKNNFLYIKAGNGSSGSVLYACNIDNPLAPVKTDTLSLNRFGGNIVIDGNYAYLSAQDQGVYIVDVSNPTDLNLVNVFSVPGGMVGDVFCADNTLFAVITTNNGFVRHIDITNPLSPSIINSSSTGGYPINCFSKRGYLHIANGVLPASSSGSFVIFNISSPYTPVFQDTLASSCRSVFVDGNYAYVTDRENLYVYEVYTPEHATCHHVINLSEGNAAGVYAKDHIIYVTTREKMRIFRHDY